MLRNKPSAPNKPSVLSRKDWNNAFVLGERTEKYYVANAPTVKEQRQQVVDGVAYKMASGLVKENFRVKQSGRVVSRAASRAAYRSGARVAGLTKTKQNLCVLAK